MWEVDVVSHCFCDTPAAAIARTKKKSGGKQAQAERSVLSMYVVVAALLALLAVAYSIVTAE